MAILNWSNKASKDVTHSEYIFVLLLMRLFLCTLVLSKSRYDIAHNYIFSVNTFFFLNCSSYWLTTKSKVERTSLVHKCVHSAKSQEIQKMLAVRK